MSESQTPIEERVYVGNVDFSATEDELREFFSGLAVSSVEIPSKTITRGKKLFVKRLGFGFVQFETKEEADKAIEQFNGKDFKNRSIYAKKALPPATEEEKKLKTEAFLARQKELKARAKTGKTNGAAEQTAAETPENGTDKTQLKTPEGNKSKDTVFIANLDYKANVKQLTNLFSELSPKWIHVPTRRVPYHVLKKFQAKQKPIFNKGIAFVKFADEELQLKAIEEFNGKEINGRTVVVEAAIDREIPQVESNSDASNTAVESSPAESS